MQWNYVANGCAPHRHTAAQLPAHQQMTAMEKVVGKCGHLTLSCGKDSSLAFSSTALSHFNLTHTEHEAENEAAASIPTEKTTPNPTVQLPCPSDHHRQSNANQHQHRTSLEIGDEIASRTAASSAHGSVAPSCGPPGGRRDNMLQDDSSF